MYICDCDLCIQAFYSNVLQKIPICLMAQVDALQKEMIRMEHKAEIYKKRTLEKKTSPIEKTHACYDLACFCFKFGISVFCFAKMAALA